MGYSLYIVCKNDAQLKLAQAFYTNNAKVFSSLFRKDDDVPEHFFGKDFDHSKYLKANKLLSYCHHKNALGFDYSPGAESSSYIWRVLSFLALRVGRSKTIGNQFGKFLCFDGTEEYIIEDNFDNGFRPISMSLYMLPAESNKRVTLVLEQRIREELERLADLWPITADNII
jgi:hypothetical protein